MIGTKESLEETLNREIKWLKNNSTSLESILDEKYPATLRDQDFMKNVKDAKDCIIRIQMALKGVGRNKS